MEKLASGTTRKCANCGQVGHIKTNKKYATLPSLPSPRLVGGSATACRPRSWPKPGVPQAREAPGKSRTPSPRAMCQAAQAGGETAGQEADRRNQAGEEAGLSRREARKGGCHNTEATRQRAAPSCKEGLCSRQPSQASGSRSQHEGYGRRGPHAPETGHASQRRYASTFAAFASSILPFHFWQHSFQFTAALALFTVSLTSLVLKVMSLA